MCVVEAEEKTMIPTQSRPYEYSTLDLQQAIEWYLSLPKSKGEQVRRLASCINRMTGMAVTDAITFLYKQSTR